MMASHYAVVVSALIAVAIATPYDGGEKIPKDVDMSTTTAPVTLSAHHGDCTKYYESTNGTRVEKVCSNLAVFTDTLKICVPAGSEKDTCTRQHPQRECKNMTVDFIPHPIACQRYYDCSDTKLSHCTPGSAFQPYEKECPYPQVFDINLKKCVHYDGAECGEGRVVSKWACDYLANQCTRCTPCYISNPSCIGKEDGKWAHMARKWSSMYVECKDERVHKTGVCHQSSKTTTHIFHPDKRICVPRREVSPSDWIQPGIGKRDFRHRYPGPYPK